MLFAQSDNFTQNYELRKRFSIAPVLSFFQNNADYTANTKASPGFDVRAEEEILFRTNISILTGLEYVRQGMTFNSYYFEPGYSLIYNKKFDYQHTLSTNEFQLPILVKQSFSSEKDNKNTFYFVAGWALHYMMYAHATIVSGLDGQELFKGKTNLDVQYPLFGNKFGSILQAGLGFQHNNRILQKAVFIDFIYKYTINQFLYTGNGTSNKINFRNSSLSISIGYRM
ncbi:MAG TPA: outer membrane beta-barrel protein [Bacteroidia bacterium]|nr:outer membrane beta-barrel protein [Bacteroidia bacterium]